MDLPVLVFDDDCGFCSWWARYFRRHSDVPLVGFSDLEEYPDVQGRLPADYESCSHLVTEAAVYSCGASIEEALLRSDVCPWLSGPVGFLRHFQDYNRLREWGYRFVADRRDLFGRVLSAAPPTRQDADEASGPG